MWKKIIYCWLILKQHPYRWLVVVPMGLLGIMQTLVYGVIPFEVQTDYYFLTVVPNIGWHWYAVLILFLAIFLILLSSATLLIEKDKIILDLGGGYDTPFFAIAPKITLQPGFLRIEFYTENEGRPSSETAFACCMVQKNNFSLIKEESTKINDTIKKGLKGCFPFDLPIQMLSSEYSPAYFMFFIHSVDKNGNSSKQAKFFSWNGIKKEVVDPLLGALSIEEKNVLIEKFGEQLIFQHPIKDHIQQ